MSTAIRRPWPVISPLSRRVARSPAASVQLPRTDLFDIAFAALSSPFFVVLILDPLPPSRLKSFRRPLYKFQLIASAIQDFQKSHDIGLVDPNLSVMLFYLYTGSLAQLLKRTLVNILGVLGPY